MSVTTTVHLNFRGQARAALEFYQSVFGGRLTVATYADAHRVQRPEEADQVIWGEVQSEAGFHVMAFDVPGDRAHDPGVEAVFVSVRGQDEDEIRGYWDKIVVGGTVREPLEPSGWAKLYGMVADQFGVIWVLDVMAPFEG
ncbi:VOC family protein [Kineosporia rhizophila]|uniref:VOC family protein n=1 Tax=Kineosporia rhizophila TaxID=84633 RepID=UPI001E5EA184|nr:VOC family protein [Kineosporia rhizophila]MCE0534583.1 VOC family protein [Kineosporia rhizophila]